MDASCVDRCQKPLRSTISPRRMSSEGFRQRDILEVCRMVRDSVHTEALLPICMPLCIIAMQDELLRCYSKAQPIAFISTSRNTREKPDNDKGQRERAHRSIHLIRYALIYRVRGGWSLVEIGIALAMNQEQFSLSCYYLLQPWSVHSFHSACDSREAVFVCMRYCTEFWACCPCEVPWHKLVTICYIPSDVCRHLA
jgi:hypothetical protein